MRIELKKSQLTKYGTSVYLAVMFLAFPLFYNNSYLNILEAKTWFFVAVTCVYFIVFAILIWLESVRNAEMKRKLQAKHKKKSKNNSKTTGRRFLLQDIFFVVFLGAVIMSTLCSGDIVNAWLSPRCKMFGTMILLLCCGIYCFVSKGYVMNKAVRISLTAGTGIVFVLAVLNRYGFDPLHMQSAINASQRAIYISTIGNINILANFICIFIPLFIGLFLYAERPADKVITGVLTYTGVMAGIATNSDSFFLGFGACMVFFLWFCMTSREKMTRYFVMCALCAGALMSLKIFNKVSRFHYVWEDIQSALIENVPWLLVAAGCIVSAVLAAKLDFALNWLKIRRVVFAILGICLAGFIIYVIKVNIAGGNNVSSYLIFSEKWGTNRGFVWIHTCELFRDLPFYNQLIGIGPGGFSDFFKVYNVERAAHSLANFADPHSEVLYYLVSTGIIGMIGYFGMIISAIVGCVKAGSSNAVIIAAIFISWIAQGTVNNPLVFVTPYLFIFLAMSRYEIKNRYY